MQAADAARAAGDAEKLAEAALGLGRQSAFDEVIDAPRKTHDPLVQLPRGGARRASRRGQSSSGEAALPGSRPRSSGDRASDERRRSLVREAVEMAERLGDRRSHRGADQQASGARWAPAMQRRGSRTPPGSSASRRRPETGSESFRRVRRGSTTCSSSATWLRRTSRSSGSRSWLEPCGSLATWPTPRRSVRCGASWMESSMRARSSLSARSR